MVTGCCDLECCWHCCTASSTWLTTLSLRPPASQLFRKPTCTRGRVPSRLRPLAGGCAILQACKISKNKIIIIQGCVQPATWRRVVSSQVIGCMHKGVDVQQGLAPQGSQGCPLGLQPKQETNGLLSCCHVHCFRLLCVECQMSQDAYQDLIAYRVS